MKSYPINRIAAAIICGMSSLILSAQQRTMSQAAAIAQETLSTNRTNHTVKAVGSNLLELVIGQHLSYARQSQEIPSFAIIDKQPFYIFNDESSQSFAIVAGDERMGDVLGYSTTSLFTVDNLPDGLVGLLQFYAQTYAKIIQTKTSSRSPKRSFPWEAVPQLIKTKWGQFSPYNAYCPIHQGQNSLVGCAATAMAQVMRYHKWPERGRGSYTYTSKTAKLQQDMDFETVTFNWNNMADSYNNNDEAHDVATLSHACGVSIAMDYTSYNSNAYIVDIPYALIQYFNYSSDAVCYRKEYFSSDKWASIIQRELQEGRPIITRGANENDNNGHLFVIDGCTETGYLHINWGWYGNFDGYYNINDIAVGSDDYSYGQFIIAKISPNDLGEPEDPFYASMFTAQHMDTYTATQLTNVYCYSSSTCLKDPNLTFDCTMGIEVYDTHGNAIALIGGYQESLRCTWGYRAYNINFRDDEIELPDGKYTLKPVVVNNTSKVITPIRTLNGETDSLFLFIADSNVDISLDGTTSITPPKATTTTLKGVYDLSGRRISNANSNGLYIKNGQKRLLKKY